MEKLDKLIAIINEALKGSGKSKLTDEQLAVGGFISPNNRHFLNNIGSLCTNYLEVGSHIGSSLVSVVYGNENIKSAIACDNFSLFSTPEQNVKGEFISNCDRSIEGRYKLIEKDCYTLTKKDIPNKVDLYYYDGDHSYESQYKGITHFAKFLTDDAIVIVDDFSWKDPNEGTMDGIRDAGLKIKYMMTLYSGQESDCSEKGFWNGYCIFMLKK